MPLAVLPPKNRPKVGLHARLLAIRARLGAADQAAGALAALVARPDPALLEAMLHGVRVSDAGLTPGRFFQSEGVLPQGQLTASLHYLLALLGDQVPLSARFQALTALDLSGLPLHLGLGPFAALPRLRSLRAAGATGGFGGVGALGTLAELEVLDLSGADYDDDLRPLEGAGRLRTLLLAGKRPDLKLPDLSKLPELTALSLPPSRRRKTLRQLRAAPQLTSLTATSWPALSDLSALRRLAGLRHLSLPGCRAITDISALSSLSSLESLDLTGCASLEDTRPLLGLQQLRALRLGRIPAAMSFSRAPVTLEGRGAVAVYLRRVGRGTFPARRGALRRPYRQLRSMLLDADPEQRAQGLELLAALGDPDLLDVLVQGAEVVGGRLVAGPALRRRGPQDDDDSTLILAMLCALSGGAPHPMSTELAGLRELRITRSSAALLGGLRLLSGLRRLSIDGLPGASALERLSPLAGLRELTVQDADTLERLDGLSLLRLESLSLHRLPALGALKLDAPNLRHLSISRCGRLQSLELRAPRLQSLVLDGLPALTRAAVDTPSLVTLQLWRLHRLVALSLRADALRLADLDQSNALRELPAALLGPRLKRLTLSRLYALDALPDLSRLSSLRAMSLYDLPRIAALPPLPSGLRALRLEHLIGLEDITDLLSAPHLESLRLHGTGSISDGAYIIDHLTELQLLDLRRAGALTERVGQRALVLRGDVAAQLKRSGALAR